MKCSTQSIVTRIYGLLSSNANLFSVPR